MTEEELLWLIEHDGTVLLGKDEIARRINLLFYSPRDRMWFVAVQDEIRRVIITIIPFESHERWNVAPSVIKFAVIAAQKLKSRI